MLWRFFQEFSSGLLRAFAAAGDARPPALRRDHHIDPTSA